MIRSQWMAAGCAVLLLANAAQGESADPSEAERPPFEKLRFEEHWSALADPPVAGPHWADPLKHVALTEEGSAWVSFGGQLRGRIEPWNDFGLRDEADELFGLWRLRAHSDLHLGGRSAADLDTLALQNGFVESGPRDGIDFAYRVLRYTF